MRDLQVALKGLCLYEHEDDFLYAEHGQDTISFPLALVKEAIERAIKAEAENAKLRKVVDAARAYLKCGYDETLLELDKEGER